MPPVVDDHYSARHGRLRNLKGWKVNWKSGGLWERFFAALIFAGAALAIVSIVAALLLDGASADWPRLPLVGNSVVFTFLPAMWALESAATVDAMMQAGFEHPDLARMKIEYFERFGKTGGNMVARRWGILCILVYAAWLPGGLWALPAVGFRDLLVVVLLDALLVFGLPI